MGILANLIGGGAASLVREVGKAGDSLFTSAEEKGRIEVDLRRLDIEEARLKDRAAERQAEINREEARHHSVAVAGWRPFAGWVCSIGMAYHFLFYPLVGPFIEKFIGVELYDLDWQSLAGMLSGMLGLGGYRAYEKSKGVAREHLYPIKKKK